MGLIYMATNKINGKRYVGQTTQTLYARKHQHICRGKVSGNAFDCALNKYGPSAFRWDILHDGILDQAELDRLEVEEIARHNSMAPYGYNLRRGGEGGAFSSVARERIRKLRNTPEYKKGMSEASKKTFTASKQAKMMASLSRPDVELRRRIAVIAAHSKRVLCLDTMVEYGSAIEAGRLSGVNVEAIRKCAQGRRHTAGGKRWRYMNG